MRCLIFDAGLDEEVLGTNNECYQMQFLNETGLEKRWPYHVLVFVELENKYLIIPLGKTEAGQEVKGYSDKTKASRLARTENLYTLIISRDVVFLNQSLR